MTHAGARAVWDIPRLKGDDVLRAVADTGGVIGMSAAPHTTVSRTRTRGTASLSVMDHFRYCLDLVGIDAVAFGPDTLYGDHVGLHTTFAGLLATEPRPGRAGARAGALRRRAGEPDGELPQHRRLAGAATGFTDEEIGKVLGGNILRALEAIWV